MAFVPGTRNELDDGDSEAYYIYARYVDHLTSHRDDDELWRRSYQFFELLSTGAGSLAEMLVVGLFEPLCEDPEVANRPRSNLGPVAMKHLVQMGRFGPNGRFLTREDDGSGR